MPSDFIMKSTAANKRRGKKLERIKMKTENKFCSFENFEREKKTENNEQIYIAVHGKRFASHKAHTHLPLFQRTEVGHISLVLVFHFYTHQMN